MKITVIPQDRGKKAFRIIEVCFEYSDDVHIWNVIAQVETNGDDYKCIMVDGADEVSDHVMTCIEQEAEERAWRLDNQPKNTRAGCDCLPKVNPLDQAIHDDTCPLRLQGEERQAFDELVRKEKREAHRFSRSEYEQEQRRRLDENTDIYLRLK